MTLSTVSVSPMYPFLFFLVPFFAMLALAIALIPCMHSPGARMGSSVKALYCYIFQSIGVAMMTAGALPAIHGVLLKFSTGAERYSAETYLWLLLLFTVGGIDFLWHEQVAERIDDASRRLPALLFWYTFKMIGNLLVLVGALAFLFTMLQTRPLSGAWWITPVIIFLYGILVSWCTRTPATTTAFRLLPIHNGMKHAPAGKKKK